MKTVTEKHQIHQNINMLDGYLALATDPEYSFALELIRKGTCFIAVRHDSGGYKFYPSRFVGYISNSRDGHLNNPNKDGRETNRALNQVLGSRPMSDLVLDRLYRDWCQTLGFVANERGAFGVERKFWVALDDLY